MLITINRMINKKTVTKSKITKNGNYRSGVIQAMMNYKNCNTLINLF